jgi:hypothetical protein
MNSPQVYPKQLNTEQKELIQLALVEGCNLYKAYQDAAGRRDNAIRRSRRLGRTVGASIGIGIAVLAGGTARQVASNAAESAISITAEAIRDSQDGETSSACIDTRIKRISDPSREDLRFGDIGDEYDDELKASCGEASYDLALVDGIQFYANYVANKPGDFVNFIADPIGTGLTGIVLGGMGAAIGSSVRARRFTKKYDQEHANDVIPTNLVQEAIEKIPDWPSIIPTRVVYKEIDPATPFLLGFAVGNIID